MNAAASNRTYTAADVRGDLSEMRISRQSMDVYVETFADLTFGQKSFPEVAEALSASSVKLGVDCLLFTAALTRTLERAVDWENVGIVVTQQDLTRQVLKDMKSSGKVTPSLNDVNIAQGKHENYEKKLDKYITDHNLRKKNPLVLEDAQIKAYGLSVADYSERLICVPNPNKEHIRKCEMKKILRTKEQLKRVKGKMQKLTPIFDELKSSLSTLTHKPPEYSKSLLRGKTLGRAMMGFAFGVSIADEVDVEIKASKLEETVKSVEINDALTSSVVVETIRSWQAWQELASVSIS
jgi:K+/H+ antiporter YhaU regulatory subunit KhtT